MSESTKASKTAPNGAAIAWFRNDLRLRDNPALRAANDRGEPVIPVFIWDPDSEGAWVPGGASKWWLHRSLASLAESLEKAGSRLILRKGEPLDVLRSLAKETGATHLFWNRRYEPAAVERNKKIKAKLAKDGLTVKSFNGALLAEPWEIANKAGKPFQVFTPMYRHYQATVEPAEPLPAPRSLAAPSRWPSSSKLSDFNLEPVPDWAGGLREMWEPGEKGAMARFNGFEPEAIAEYPDQRDFPAVRGTSTLSPHLHFGEISPRLVWHQTQETVATQSKSGLNRGAEGWLRQLVWREFAHHLLYHFPHTPEAPLREEFGAFPWLEDDEGLRAWQKGRTGYPIVDAGMRELWHTGWMHNRVRMIVGSFLVKDLLIHWLEGARWFWDTLVDADLANNTLGWQWVGGCGADAAPYFRIFNPMLQSKKFDPDGVYLRRWIPELAKLPDAALHAPWEADSTTLKAAGVHLGETYPRPIVDHGEARDRALEALSAIRKP